jgi:WD40 repeat protein
MAKTTMLVLSLTAIIAVGSGLALPHFLFRIMYPAPTFSAMLKLRREQTFTGAHKGFFSPTGSHLALMDKDYIDVIELASGRKLFRLAPPSASFLGAAFSPDGRLLATAYRVEDGGQTPSIKVTLWDAVSGKEVRTLPATDHDWRRPVDNLSFSGDGQLLASNIGGIARLWEVSTGREVRRFLPPSGPEGIEAERALLSPDGKWLAVQFKLQSPQHSYDAIHMWNLATGQQRVLETAVYLDWAFSADSTSLAVTAIADKGKVSERSVAEIWEVNSGQRKQVIEVPRPWQGAFALAFSPDATLLVIGGRKMFGIYATQTGTLLVEEAHLSSRFGVESQQIYDLSHIEFSPDGHLLLTGGNDRTIKLWNIVKS